MWEEQLRGIIVGYANCPFGIVPVGGDIESLIGATDRMNEDTSKESFKHESVDVVLVVSFVFKVRLWKIDDFHNSRRARVQQLVQHFEGSVICSSEKMSW